MIAVYGHRQWHREFPAQDEDHYIVRLANKSEQTDDMHY
jgi:hypothetical protein